MSRLLTILGPTASGKSSVAMELARRLSGEIISCDSMQIYRKLDIGTAKPSIDDLAEVPHHLIDILEIEEPYNVRRFIEDADRAIDSVSAGNHQPIMCGGTGLYARALLYGFNMWPSDKIVAQELREELRSGNESDMLIELANVSPEFAERTKGNSRHWLRALEVVRITGRAPTLQEEFVPPGYAVPEYVLMPSPELSRERIRRRTEIMLKDGWIEEVEEVGRERLMGSATAKQALGYRTIIDYLRGDIESRDELFERLVTLTARYAKRQRTWFRHQHPNAVVIPVQEGGSADTLASHILEHFSKS